MNTFSVIIPIFRLQSDSTRLRSFQYLINELCTKLNPYEVIICEQLPDGEEPLADYPQHENINHLIVRLPGDTHTNLNKPRLINTAADAVKTDILIFMDSDTIANWDVVRDAAIQLKRGTVCKPFDFVRRTTEDGANSIYNSGRIVESQWDGVTNVLGAGVLIIFKDDFELAGKYDERYEGWGVEDEAFGRVCKALFTIQEIKSPAYHLYHPRNKTSLMQEKQYIDKRQIFKSSVYPQTVLEGFAVVAAAWGYHPDLHRAIQMATSSWFMESAQPQNYVFVNACEDDEIRMLPENPNVTYIHIPLYGNNKFLYQQQALWNTAFRYIEEHMPYIKRVLFLDPHVWFPNSNRMYFAQVNTALVTKAPIIQPYSKCITTGTNETMPGLVRCIKTQEQLSGATAGYAYATDVDVHKSTFSSFVEVPIHSGMIAHWMKIVPNGHALKIPCGGPIRRIAKYGAPAHRPKFDYIDVPIAHISHDQVVQQSEQSKLLIHACSDYSDVVIPTTKYDSIKNLSARYTTPLGEAFSECMAELHTVKGARQVRDLWDRKYLKIVKPVQNLVVATVLRSGGEYGPEHVLWLKNQLDEHLKTPFDFMCLSDVDIDGVDVVYLNEEFPTTRSKIELFRPGVFLSGATVFYLDLDSVVLRDFELPRCPIDTVYYVRENERRDSWPAWNSSCMYFRQSERYYEIYEHFRRLRCEGYDPAWLFPGEQEFTWTTIAHKKLAIIQDIERVVCVRFWNKNITPQPEETHIVTWASPGNKPWRVNAPWIPSLGKV